MGFDITKFQRKYKDLVEENRVLREQVAEFEKQKAIDIQNAVQAAVAPFRQEVQQLKANIAHEQRKTKAAEIEKEILATRVAELEAALEHQKTALEQERAAHRETQARYDAVKPELQLAEEKYKKLSDELKRHEDKMSKRQRMRIAAIENRRLLAAAVPQRNLR